MNMFYTGFVLDKVDSRLWMNIWTLTLKAENEETVNFCSDGHTQEEELSPFAIVVNRSLPCGYVSIDMNMNEAVTSYLQEVKSFISLSSCPNTKIQTTLSNKHHNKRTNPHGVSFHDY